MAYSVMAAAAVLCTASSGLAVETPCQAHSDCDMHSGESCYFSYDEKASSGFCFMEMGETVEPAVKSAPKPKTGASMKRGGIVVQGEAGQSAMLKVLTGKIGYKMGITGTPSRFAIQKSDGKNADLVTVTADGDVTLSSKNLEAVTVEADEQVQVNNVAQWQIVKKEDYATDPTTQNVPGAEGWKAVPAIVGKNAILISVSNCGGMSMLGGYNNFNQAGYAAKTFKVNVGAGASEVRITSRFHFIDMWLGQSGFLKVSQPDGKGEAAKWSDPSPVWTQQYETAPNKPSDDPVVSLLDVCGNDKVGEFKFSNNIDVVVPLAGRNKASPAGEVEIKLVFGSTMSVPVDENTVTDGSWGVSGVEFWSR
jgi:hypothetical protein